MKNPSKNMSASLRGQHIMNSKDPMTAEVSGLKKGMGSGIWPGERCTETPPGMHQPASVAHMAPVLGRMVGGKG